MPHWRVPVELLIAGETSATAVRWADRALGALVAQDADFARALGRRPPRYLLGAVRAEAAPLPRRPWSPPQRAAAREKRP
jgi:hypothetical protein